ncbi:cytochrome P450 [Xylaria longipes]|nr:cytochrome P450 [Xylaria longipes]
MCGIIVKTICRHPTNMAAHTQSAEYNAHLAVQTFPFSFFGFLDQSSNGQQTLKIFAATSAILFAFFLLYSTLRRNEFALVNRLFPLEPSFFSRLRWSTQALSILDAADKKFKGLPYKLARGDKELIVLPVALIPELNRLGPDVLDARQSHAVAFVAHLTGLELTVKASYQSRILQRRVSPALPELFLPMATRISVAMKQNLPDGDEWEEIKPLAAIVPCFSEGMSMVLFGVEMVKSPRLVELAYKLTEDLFTVAFMMRLVPSVLQPILVWFLPAKWNLNRKWRELESFVGPEVQRQKKLKEDGGSTTGMDLLSCMVRDAATAFEQDASVLTTLCGSVATAAIFSVGNLICHLIADLAANPDILTEVRVEIRTKHAEIGGRWDLPALGSLEKLESAMKETARLASSPLIVYNRVVKKDCVLGGVHLKQGQFITMSGRQRTMDPTLYEDPDVYKGLRFCKPDKIKEHRARPFHTVDTDILTWGAGRAACPGRLIADVAAKIFLVQLLDEYDFAFVDGKPPKPSMFHEFVFFNPENKMLFRRREDSIGIEF